MSLRKRVAIVVLGLAVALAVGRSLTTKTWRHAVSAMASAVWGS